MNLICCLGLWLSQHGFRLLQIHLLFQLRLMGVWKIVTECNWYDWKWTWPQPFQVFFISNPATRVKSDAKRKKSAWKLKQVHNEWTFCPCIVDKTPSVFLKLPWDRSVLPPRQILPMEIHDFFKVAFCLTHERTIFVRSRASISSISSVFHGYSDIAKDRWGAAFAMVLFFTKFDCVLSSAEVWFYYPIPHITLSVSRAVLVQIWVSHCLFLAVKTFSDSDPTAFPHLGVAAFHRPRWLHSTGRALLQIIGETCWS